MAVWCCAATILWMEILEILAAVRLGCDQPGQPAGGVLRTVFGVICLHPAPCTLHSALCTLRSAFGRALLSRPPRIPRQSHTPLSHSLSHPTATATTTATRTPYTLSLPHPLLHPDLPTCLPTCPRISRRIFDSDRKRVSSSSSLF